MNKEQTLLKAKLYVVVDADLLGHKNLEKITLQAVEGGADLIQFRDKTSDDCEFLKTAESIKKITDSKDIPFIVNDRVDAALFLDAAGVHLGQEDSPISVARQVLGEEKIIGISASNLKQARKAQENGADYIGVGPVFHTQTKKIEKAIGVKPILEIKQNTSIPLFVIGGISLGNIDQLVKKGINKIAVISAVIKAENVKLAARKLKERL